VIRALPPAFVGNCPRGHCEQEWYKTPPLSKSTSLKSAYSRQECSNRGVIRALPPAFVGNCPMQGCQVPLTLHGHFSLKSRPFFDLSRPQHFPPRPLLRPLPKLSTDFLRAKTKKFFFSRITAYVNDASHSEWSYQSHVRSQ
jgi:hypothetical protein